MIISIASGKGGTGKTTVAVNFAVSIASKVQLIDCDVEEPNAHLFIKPVIENKKTVTIPVPEIDEEKCNQCGKCGEVCRFNAITLVGSSVLTFPALCHGCGGCLRVCPENAITETGREIGVMESGHKNDLGFVHGRLRIGEAMSPPLIADVRSYTDPEMLTIIDAPPGTSCPVITAIKGADFILMVTEPTPFGLHDLRLGVEAVKLLGIPHGLIINRSDIGNDSVKKYADEEKIPILMEIPFDRKIAESYSRGELLVESMPEWKEKFQKLYHDIKKQEARS